MVEVTVNDPSHKFEIPKALICGHSAYFDKAFKGPFEEGRENAITLSDVDANTFGYFVGWLYTQRIGALVDGEYATEIDASSGIDSRQQVTQALDTSVSSQKDAEDSHGNAVTQEEVAEDEDELDPRDPVTWGFLTLFELYVFADKYDTRRLRTATVEITQIKAFQTKPREYLYPAMSELAWAFENLPATSPLYKLLLNIVCFSINPQKPAEFYEGLPNAILAATCNKTRLALDCRCCDYCIATLDVADEVDPDPDTDCEDDGCARCARRCKDQAHIDAYKEKVNYVLDVCAHHEHVTQEEKKLCAVRWEMIKQERGIA